MKKRNKKRQIFNSIKTSLILGIATFFIISVSLTVSAWMFRLLTDWDIVRDNNGRFIWLLDNAAVSTIIGAVFSFVIMHKPIKRLQMLIEAMERISNGDFSVRLNTRSKVRIVRKATKVFNQMAGQLDATETLSRDFINNFSHEFKSPIASVSGFAKLLKNNNLSEEDRNEYLDIIISESERLSDLSTNILDLSKLEQQTILTNKTYFNICEQIRITIGTLYPKWSVKNISVDFEADETDIPANKAMLGQVWSNLLDNAIKFSPENETITIRLQNDDNNDCVLISIENKGKTVPDNNAQRVFDKFYQGDASHSTTGTGLGLTMVRRIIELHDGTIEFRTGLTDTTVFDILLPKE